MVKSPHCSAGNRAPIPGRGTKVPHAAEQISPHTTATRASQVALVGKNPPAHAGDGRVAGSIPGSGRSSGGGHSNPESDMNETTKESVHRNEEPAQLSK